MSSHHFVKDGQEPALIIANGQRCQTELVHQLLEWCPFVLVLDGALQDVLDLGIAINAVSGDFDSETQALEKTAHLGNVEIIHTPDQDYTDLQKGINICKAKGFNHIHVLWGTGLRMDHSIGNLDLIVRLKNEVNLVFWDNHHKIYHAPDGFKKWFAKDLQISLIPWPVCKNISADNLVWPLNSVDLRMAFSLSNSNAIQTSGFLHINYTEGNLILMEELRMDLSI